MLGLWIAASKLQGRSNHAPIERPLYMYTGAESPPRAVVHHPAHPAYCDAGVSFFCSASAWSMNFLWGCQTRVCFRSELGEEERT